MSTFRQIPFGKIINLLISSINTTTVLQEEKALALNNPLEVDMLFNKETKLNHFSDLEKIVKNKKKLTPDY